MPAKGRVVLIVDDDADVRELAATILEDAGLRVIAAESAEAALALVRGPAGIDLMLTDVVMPGMSGFRLAQMSNSIRPDLPVLFMSAYAVDVPLAEEAIRDGRLLPKPWSTNQLLKKVHGSLRERAERRTSG